MKALLEVVEVIKDSSALETRLIQLSTSTNAAVVYWIEPFSHTTHFHAYRNPSEVPDRFIDDTRNRIAWKGRIQSFSHAAAAREQNRRLGRE